MFKTEIKIAGYRLMLISESYQGLLTEAKLHKEAVEKEGLKLTKKVKVISSRAIRYE